MRPHWVFVVAAVLAVGRVRAQEPAPGAPYPEAADPPVASAFESSGFLRPRPSLRSRLASWRPISRWLGRTSPSQDQEPVPIRVVENPQQPAEDIGGSAPPRPAVNPLEGDSGTTPPAPSN